MKFFFEFKVGGLHFAGINQHKDSLPVSLIKQRIEERFIFSVNDDFEMAKDMINSNPELRHGIRMQEATGKF